MALLSEPLTESSIKILFFSGKPDDYLVWKSKQLAKAGRYGYLDLILGNTSLPTDAERLTAKAVDEEKRTKQQLEILENWKLGCRGYEDLILAMNTTDPQGMVACRKGENSGEQARRRQASFRSARDQICAANCAELYETRSRVYQRSLHASYIGSGYVYQKPRRPSSTNEHD